MSSFKRRLAGFTLLELVIVVIIVAILAGLGIPQFAKTVEKARWAEATATLGVIRKACFMYYTAYGTYPSAANLNGSHKNVTNAFEVTIEEPDSDGRYCYRLDGDDYSANPTSTARAAYAWIDINGDGLWAGGERYLRIYYDGHYFTYPEF